MLDELITIKIKKIVEREYNRFILVNGALLLLGTLALGFSLIASNILVYFSLLVYFMYLYILKRNINNLNNKIINILNKALTLKEFRSYITKIYDEYIPDNLYYIKIFESNKVEVLSDIEESEYRRLIALSELYRNVLSSVKTRIWLSSLAGLVSSIVLLVISPVGLIIKIIYIILIVLIIDYIKKIY